MTEAAIAAAAADVVAVAVAVAAAARDAEALVTAPGAPHPEAWRVFAAPTGNVLHL